MPVNWSLLNPALPAAAQTINPFAALNAGRAQAEERIQNQQMGELRGLQIEGARAGLESQKTAGQAAALATQAWQLRESDPAKAAEILQQGMALNPSAFSETTKELVQRARDEAATASSRATAATAEQKLKAPFMLRAVQMAKEGDVDGAREFLRSAGIYDPQHEQFLTNPKVLPAFEETLRPLVPIDQRTEMTAYQQELADAAKRRADASVAAANRPPATGGGRRDTSWQVIDGRRVLVDDQTGEQIRDAGAAPAGRGNGGQQGSVERRFNEQFIGAAQSAFKDVSNVMRMRVSSNAGPFGIGSRPGKDILRSSLDTLRNQLSDEDVQRYVQQADNSARMIAYVETGGRQISESMVSEIKDALVIREGDTGYTALQRLATYRQIIEQFVGPKLASEALPAEQKSILRRALSNLSRDIPFTVDDVTNLERGQVRVQPKKGESFIEYARRAFNRPVARPAPRLDTTNPFSTPALGTPAAPLPLQQPAPARPAAPASGGWGIQRIE